MFCYLNNLEDNFVISSSHCIYKFINSNKPYFIWQLFQDKNSQVEWIIQQMVYNKPWTVCFRSPLEISGCFKQFHYLFITVLIQVGYILLCYIKANDVIIPWIYILGKPFKTHLSLGVPEYILNRKRQGNSLGTGQNEALKEQRLRICLPNFTRHVFIWKL